MPNTSEVRPICKECGEIMWDLVLHDVSIEHGHVWDDEMHSLWKCTNKACSNYGMLFNFED